MKIFAAVLRLLMICTLALLIAGPLAGVSRAQSPKLQLSSCKFDVGLGEAKHQVDAMCGVMAVPEDWSKLNGKKLDIHLTLLPTTNTDHKALPIFHFEGGPGASAITNFGETWYPSFRGLMQDHDIVLIDQRGAGLSASLQCHESSDQALKDLADPLTDAESQKLALDQLQACLKRLSAVTDPGHYTTQAMADDTDAIRDGLGYDQIDVFGNSYGTTLGQSYLARHGQHVHAMVLDSIVGPWNYAFLDAANNAQASLDKVIALCEADTDCNKAYPDLHGKFKAALDKLNGTHVRMMANSSLTGDAYPVSITRSRLLEAFRQMLYQGALIGSIPQAISQAADGNYTLPAATLVAENELLDISIGLYYSVDCAEDVPFYTDTLIKQYQRGSFYDSDTQYVENTRAICKIWRSGELSANDVSPVKSDRPVLIFSGVFDPITPIAFGEEAKQRLGHSTLAVFPYEAHGPTANSKCAQKMIAAFFAAPDKPVDTSCTAQDVKPIFAGAYTVNLVPYSDPSGKFSANIPENWQPQTGSGPVTFFVSPDKMQLLGLAIVKGGKADEVQQQVINFIEKTYGRVDIEAKLSTFGSTIIVHTLDRPDQVYTGTLIIFPFGNDMHILWEAAPNNIFTTAFSAIAPNILLTLR